MLHTTFNLGVGKINQCSRNSGGVFLSPFDFLVEGGIFSLECPRATAVFGQTVMSVVRGVGFLNDQSSFLSALSMMWGGFYEPYP